MKQKQTKKLINERIANWLIELASKALKDKWNRINEINEDWMKTCSQERMNGAKCNLIQTGAINQLILNSSKFN